MPTPTSSSESRSERFNRLAKQAASEFPNQEFTPDGASGTPEGEVNFVGQIKDRGSIRVVMGISDAGIHVAGTLTLSNGQPIRLCRDLSREAALSCELFDLHSDRRNLATFKGLIRKFILDAQPRNSKRRRIVLDDPPGRAADPHDAPNQELATV